MTTSWKSLGSIAAMGAALSILGATPSTSAFSPSHRVAEAQQPAIHIPASVRSEHQEIHSALVAATKAKGKVGAAARDLAKILDPHFKREEKIALPPLGLLVPLSRGEFNAQMRDVLPMTDSLRTELPRMLDEHKAIHAATERMGQAARAQGNAKIERLAEQLALHAQSEEEVFYPAAVLVGDLVRARGAGGRK